MMIIVDSDVLMDFLKGKPRAKRFISSQSAQGKRLVTTTINAAEILRGALRARSEQELRASRNLLNGLAQLPFGPRAAERFGSLMAGLDAEGTPIPPADGMIAAIALESSAPIVTRNIRHFENVPELVVKNPEE